MKVIYDNIVYYLQKAGGISVYWKELSSRLISSPNIEPFFLEYNDQIVNIFRNDLELHDNIIYLNKVINLKLSRYINPTVHRREFSNDICIFHSSYYRIMNKKNVINVVTVHDFTYEKTMTSFASKIHILQKVKSLKKADGIICISNNTKKDMLDLYPFLINKKIKVIHNGYDKKSYFAKNSSNKFDDFVLFVGARKGYKNFYAAVDVVARISDIKLYIVGSKLDEDEMLYLKNKIFGRYSLFEHISNNELNSLYNNAIALLYLSEYEGFGIPVIEAMSSGCPVIALNKSSIPEISNGAAILFDSTKDNQIVNTVSRLMHEPDFRSNIVKTGIENSKKFSWDITYKAVLNFYNELKDDFSSKNLK